MVLTSEFIKLCRDIPFLKDNIILETREPKHTVAKIRWLKEYFQDYIKELEEGMLTRSLSELVIKCVDWERVIKTFTGEKMSEE